MLEALNVHYITMSHPRYLKILCVTVGSLASSVTDSWTLLCGASGGVYALIGAHFAKLIMVR